MNQLETGMNPGSVLCLGDNKGTYISKGTCAVKLSMCTNLTIAYTPSNSTALSEPCLTQQCKRDPFLLKFDRFGSFQWGIPLHEDAGTVETRYWGTQAKKYLEMSAPEWFDILPTWR